MKYLILIIALLFISVSVLPVQAQEKIGTCVYACQGAPDKLLTRPNACASGQDNECVGFCHTACLNRQDTCAAQPAPQCQTASAAQTGQPVYQGRYGLKDPLQGANIPQIISGIIRYSMGFVGALFLLYFLYGGILWMTAGDSDRVKQSKKTLKYALLGMLVVMFSYTLLSVFIHYVHQINVR